MESYTRKRQSKLRNIIPNRTRVVRNANKTLKRGNASRYLVPKHPKEFRWLNTYNVPLTITSNNRNGTEELSENERAKYNEHNAALRNSRRMVPFPELQIGTVRLSPNLARKIAGIMSQHNDPVHMKNAIHANMNLTSFERQTLREYLAYLYQDINLAAPPRKKIHNVALSPRLARIYEFLSVQYAGPEYIENAILSIPNLKQEDINALLGHLMFMYQDDLA